ncbi:MAG: phytanoyl-CoA dioxygenase family protein [Alphaproteobacteria bacterium]|nr:phytanoyl-CoA dioxygenase family protein [Alphaproteobacteria bacterium]
MGPDLEDIATQDVWRALAPAFHIADAQYLAPQGAVAEVRRAEAAAGIDAEGYVHLPGLDLDAPWDAMAAVARRLSEVGLDAVFVFVYDEFWRPYYRLDALFRHLLGRYTFLPDFWAWDVDPKRRNEGWSIHRDRGRQSLRPDGSPISLTAWIAISQATRDNGCIRLVPKTADRDYGTETENAFRFREEDVRVLEAAPGDVIVWDQAVLHWGGKALAHAPHSRVSMSFEVQRLDVPSTEAPLIAPGEIVPFEARLKLIGQKLLHYRHMHAIAPALETLARRLAG